MVPRRKSYKHFGNLEQEAWTLQSKNVLLSEINSIHIMQGPSFRCLKFTLKGKKALACLSFARFTTSFSKWMNPQVTESKRVLHEYGGGGGLSPFSLPLFSCTNAIQSKPLAHQAVLPPGTMQLTFILHANETVRATALTAMLRRELCTTLAQACKVSQGVIYTANRSLTRSW